MPKRHSFRFKLRQRVVIVTDLNRGGEVLKRRKAGPGMWLLADAYLVKRDAGTTEWYPEMALEDIARAYTIEAPTSDTVSWPPLS